MEGEDRVLLTGATGFVGRALWPALVAAGYDVRAMTRDVERARSHWPDRHWVRGDVETGDGLAESLEGCAAAIFLVHGMGRGSAGYRERDRATAVRFTREAARAGLSRILYLGGVEPQGTPSEHLASRLEVGETLRTGPVPALELRASMIVGHGSLSWRIVRDLAARLPFMVLPRWMRHRTEPVAIDDVIAGLARGLALPLPESAVYDVPGPQALSAKEIIIQTARALGLRPPAMMEVPVLTPWLSSHWIKAVTSADWGVAREIVLGLGGDLLARGHDYWEIIGHAERIPFAKAACRAVEAERAAAEPIGGLAGAAEAWVRRTRSL